MINFLFLKVLNMSITASVVILFVFAARFLLRRLPKIFSYLLWGIVIFRLICPFSFTVPFSLLDLTNPKSVENGEVIYISADTLYMGEPNAAGTVLNDGGEVLNQNNMKPLTKGEQTVIPVVAYIWFLGIFGIACYSILSFVRLKRKLVGAVKCGENVWMSDYVCSSFVMGLFKPQIYLWSGLSEEEKGFVIAHEITHIRRCDHLVKLFFYLVLTVHWFNPMVWLSYFLCMKDMEMSCDESVMKKMGDGARADYSETLLSLATGRKIFAGTPLFFGEGDTKSRIKNILKYKKPTMWAVAAGVIAIVILCVGFMGNPSVSAGSQEGDFTADDEDIEDGSADHTGVEIMENQTGIFEVRYPQIQFPSQTMNPFTVQLSLPQGWVIEKRDLEAEDITDLNVNEIIGTFLTTYIFNGDGICVGKMGCNYYDLYEGEEDNPQAIYNQVALGNHYQFDVRNSYEVICQNNVIETATADVLYMEPANDGGDTTTNYGILSRSRESRVYVALELESGLVSEEEVLAIAESISFEIRENSQSLPEENGGIPKESTDLQVVWHADLTGDGEEETIVVDSTGWNGEMLVELYVWNKDGMLLWNEEGAYAHTGWNTVFLVHISGRDYLLKYNPYMGTGMASYQYEIFGLRDDPANTKEIYASDTVDFSVYLHDADNAKEMFDIDRMVEFAQGVNGYLSKGILLFSTEEGALRVGSNVGREESEFRNGDGSLIVNHDYVENYSFCDLELLASGIADRDSIDNMELREKLQVYFDKCLMNKE